MAARAMKNFSSHTVEVERMYICCSSLNSSSDRAMRGGLLRVVVTETCEKASHPKRPSFRRQEIQKRIKLKARKYAVEKVVAKNNTN